MRKKIAVLGSNSFSGSDFIDLLLEEKRFDIVGISRSPEKHPIFLPYKRHKNPTFRFYQLDYNKDMGRILSLLDSFKPEYVIDFAGLIEVAPSWDDPNQWFQTNTLAIVRLADHLKSASYLKRFVHISTAEVYGSCKGKVLEGAPLNPSTPYAASKAAADLFLWTLVKNFHFPLVLIRSTNVYGAHQQLFKIIPRSVICCKLGKKIKLHGGGKAVKSYIHIRDVSRGELLAVEKGEAGELYHFSPDRGIAVVDLVRLICREMKADFDTMVQAVDERLGQDAAYVIDSKKARRQLGWRQTKSLKEGIDEVINWIHEYWQVIKSMPREYIHKA